jgi:hypothetical protein
MTVSGGAQETEPLSGAMRRRLRVVNVCVGLVLGAEGVLMLVLSSSLSLPVTASFLRNDPVAVQGPAAGEVLFRLAIGPAVAVFLLLAMADHLLVAAPRVHRWYEASLQRRANYARWIEYSVSASIMIVLICMFTGIRDIAAPLGLFASNTVMILFGLLMECQQTAGAAQYLRAGPWRRYLTGERGYLTLSLVAKPLLAWLIDANVLRS